MPLDHQARVGRVLALVGLLREEGGTGKERGVLTRVFMKGSQYPYTPPGQKRKESLIMERTSREVEVNTVRPIGERNVWQI